MYCKQWFIRKKFTIYKQYFYNRPEFIGDFRYAGGK